MSYFRPVIDEMQGYVPGEQPQVGKFIKLNTNENPYPCSPSISLAVEAALRSGLGRYPDATATAFRHRAAELHGVEPDWVLCGNGSDEILTMCMRAFVGEGQLIRLPHPSYVLYKTLAQIQGARSEEVSFEPDWSVPASFAADGHDLRLVFLPNPNSPSGTVIAPEKIKELAVQLPCPLVVDEAYVDFADSNCIALVRDCDNVLVTRSLSKSYALAGLRFGYVIARPDIIAGLMKVKDSYNCDHLSIAAATAAIDDQSWLTETRGKVIATRTRLTDAMRRLGFDVVDSQANFVWCTQATFDLERIYEGLKEQRILVRYMNYPRWGDGLRITVGSDAQVDACLSLIEGLI